MKTILQLYDKYMLKFRFLIIISIFEFNFVIWQRMKV